MLFRSAAAVNAIPFGTNPSDVFSVTVSDGIATTSQTYTINLTGANDAPTLAAVTAGSVADAQNAATLGSSANLYGTLSGSDVDTGNTKTYGISSPTSSSANYTSSASGSAVTYNISKTGSYGTLYIESATGNYLYVADAAAVNAIPFGTNPSDSFSVTVSDGIATTSQTYTINLTGANDAPTLAAVKIGRAHV